MLYDIICVYQVVFVLLWDGCLVRCEDKSDPMRLEILTALRQPHCFVVAVAFFTTQMVRGGIMPEWLDDVSKRHDDGEKLNAFDIDSMHIYTLLSLQISFLQPN